MKTQRARASMLALTVLFSVITACGAREPSTPMAQEATVTLTDTACVGEGLGAMIPARFVATLVNKTSMPAMFTIHRLSDGHAYGELESFIAEQQRRFTEKVDQMDPPSFTTRIASATIEPQRSSRFEVPLLGGTYGFVCRALATPRLWTAYIVGPLRVP